MYNDAYTGHFVLSKDYKYLCTATSTHFSVLMLQLCTARNWLKQTFFWVPVPPTWVNCNSMPTHCVLVKIRMPHHPPRKCYLYLIIHHRKARGIVTLAVFTSRCQGWQLSVIRPDGQAYSPILNKTCNYSSITDTCLTLIIIHFHTRMAAISPSK